MSELNGTLREVRSGRSLHVAARAAGSDTTLFFLHGGGGNKEQWRFQWRQFDDGRHNLVAWDAVGHGQSPQPRVVAAYAGQALLEDVSVLFARHRTRRNIVVAHSLGARLILAWLLAEAAAGRASGIDALVLVGPAPIGSINRRALFGGWLGRLPLPLLELARPLLSRGFRKLAWDADADPQLVEAEQRATRGNSLFMMQALLAGAPEVDPEALSGLALPVVILAGENDGLVPPTSIADLAARLPNASLRVLPRCGHQIMLEKPAETNRAISDLLAVGGEA